MKRLWAATLALALAVASTGCAQKATQRKRFVAVATISILADFVKGVAGNEIDVKSIVPIGGDPHVYEPRPSDARLAAEADVVFRNGLGLERWFDKLVGETRAGRPVVTLTAGLEPLVHESGAYAGDPDPHMWMDPLLAERYVDGVLKTMTRMLPDKRRIFRTNAEIYLGRMHAVAQMIKQRTATIPKERRKLVTTHDAFRYFGNRYGFEVLGSIWGITTEREPSAEEIGRLVDVIREKNVPVVFVESTINPKLMQEVARNAGVKVGIPLYGDSVGRPGAGADSYVGMMSANVQAIVQGLNS